jgi:hypothetical protein
MSEQDIKDIAELAEKLLLQYAKNEGYLLKSNVLNAFTTATMFVIQRKELKYELK